MRSTAIFALAAASGFAFAEQSDSFKTIKNLVDNDVNSDFEATAGGSFKAGLGAGFLPAGSDVAKDASGSSSPDAKAATGTVADSIDARDATQQVYGQCGGGKYKGPTECASGSKCYRRDDSYSQCLPLVQQAYGQCGGNSYFGTNACAEGSECKQLRPDYKQCM